MPSHHHMDRHRGRGPTAHRDSSASNFGNVPSYSGLDKYDVNRPGWEAIRNALYDSATYAAAGQLSLQFFQVPLGAGTTSEPISAGVKTLGDTNMLAAGALPNNIEFLAESVEVDFQPTVPSASGGNPSSEGAGVALIPPLINDVYIFRRSGWLIFHIGSKDYLQEAPLSKFPTKAHFHLEGALSDATTAAANSKTAFQWATVTGRPYHLAPLSLRLESTQNFNINLNWGSLQVIINPARVFVRIDGVYYRRSQ